MIEIDGLTLLRDRAPVLHDVRTTIPRGGITALIGPNGAGKSTLLHAVAGLLRPTQGCVRVDGTDIHAARPEARALQVALLTQSQSVATRLTVADLVGFGRWPHHRGRPRAEDRARVSQALDAFDLCGLADRPLSRLSGGQQQRAFVAMAWAQSTPWMLLDEPLAALDPRYARDIMERLRDLSRSDTGRSVVIVLHDLAMAARYADRVVALKGGRLVTSGPRARALTGENLTALFDTPLAVATLGGHDVVY